MFVPKLLRNRIRCPIVIAAPSDRNLRGCLSRGSSRSLARVLSDVQRADFTRRVEEQLGRYGVAGRVESNGHHLRVVGPGRALTVASAEMDAFATAPPDQQARSVERIVREFVRLRRSGAPPPRPRWRDWLRPIFILGLMIACLAAAWRWLGKPARDAILARSAAESTQRVTAATGLAQSPAVPTATMCQRIQTRIATGGTVSVLDVDGWVVEMLLLSAVPTLEPTSSKLDGFFAEATTASPMRRLTWPEDAELSALESPDTFVVISSEPLVDILAGTKSGIRITLSGKFVAKYFDELGRTRMQRLAAALFEATGSSYGALYARCAATTNHQVGSWFRAKDLPSSVLALVAAMGLYAEVSHVNGADPRTNSPLEQRRIWDTLLERAPRLDRQKITLALAEDGGMIAARPGQWLTITFPFQDSNRATRASLRIAKQFGVAPRH